MNWGPFFACLHDIIVIFGWDNAMLRELGWDEKGRKGSGELLGVGNVSTERCNEAGTWEGALRGRGWRGGCLYQTVTPVRLGSFSCAYYIIEMGTLVNVRRSFLPENWGGHQQPFCGFDFFYFFTVMMVEVVCNYIEPRCDEKTRWQKYWRTWALNTPPGVSFYKQ